MDAAAQQPPFTVAQVMQQCGVALVVFNDQTMAQRIATEVFQDSFESCLDKSITDFDDDLKILSDLTVANGRIRLSSTVKRNLKAFIQWCKDKLRIGEDPSQSLFPINNVNDLLRQAKSHKLFVEKSKTLSEIAKPANFTNKTKWDDWEPSFVNFLRSIPGRNGVPLNYVIREHDNPSNEPGSDFLTHYANMAPLNGDAFDTDATEVHTYLVNFISGNETAEAKILPHANTRNGRLEFKALKDHYAGVGVHSKDILQADKIIKDLFYGGEKKPHMWWDEFEKQLCKAFVIYDRRENREVYSDSMKLRILCSKINADFLQHTKASISIALTETPITMTFAQALAAFRNAVNSKHTPEMSNNNRTRRINEMSRGGRYGRGRNNRGGRGGRGRLNHFSNQNKRKPDNVRYVTGVNGQTIEVHPSFKFNRDVWNNLPDAERNRITQERSNYKRSRQGNGEQRSTISQVTFETSNNDNNATKDSSNSSASIMGGRNEQASLRSRNSNSI